jgi:hypothetical protein
MTFTAYGRDDGGFLLHGNEFPIGWVEGRAIGFRGFATKEYAMEAARVAHRALSKWLARERHLAEVDDGAGAVRTRRDGRLHWITIGGSPIGRLLDPDTHAPVGASTFGFELLLPPSVSPVGGISAAQVIWYALKRSDEGELLARPSPSGDARRATGAQ